MSHLPPALRELAPIIAADNGRQRDETLLLLLGAGLDYVDARLSMLDQGLGTASRGLAALSALVGAARSGTSPAALGVPNQHFVTETLLGQFAEVIAPQPGAAAKVVRRNLVTGKERPVAPGGVGYRIDFVNGDSRPVESVWKGTENRLSVAAAANRTLFPTRNSFRW